MTDTIFIQGLLIHARHGVMDHEAEVGQRFVIDLELSTDLSESSRTDRLAHTVSYAEVVNAATAAFADQNYRLLERAAGAVADSILGSFPRVTRGQGYGAQAARPHRGDLSRCRRDHHADPPGDASRMTAMADALIALGGNVGDVRLTFARAIPMICSRRRGDASRPLLGLSHPAVGGAGSAAVHQCLHRHRNAADRARSAVRPPCG